MINPMKLGLLCVMLTLVVSAPPVLGRPPAPADGAEPSNPGGADPANPDASAAATPVDPAAAAAGGAGENAPAGGPGGEGADGDDDDSDSADDDDVAPAPMTGETAAQADSSLTDAGSDAPFENKGTFRRRKLLVDNL